MEADHLVLRDYREDDLESLHSLWSDSDVAKFIPPKGPRKEEDTKRLLLKALATQLERPRRYFRLAIVLKPDGEFVGDCVCRVHDPDNKEDLTHLLGEAYIGFFLHRRFWGQGYATEIARTLLRFGFEELGLHRIFAWCDRENVASSRVLEKAGMKQEGHFRESVLLGDEWRDPLVYGIIRDETKV